MAPQKLEIVLPTLTWTFYYPSYQILCTNTEKSIGKERKGSNYIPFHQKMKTWTQHPVAINIQLFWEKLSGKVHATILKGIVGGFEFSFFLKESWKNWYERLCKCVCECQRKATKVGSTATVVRNLVLIISHITFRDCRVHIFSDNLSRNSCIFRDPNSLFFRVISRAVSLMAYILAAWLQFGLPGQKCRIIYKECVVPENIQTPTTGGISLRTPPPPPPPWTFPFLQGTDDPPPLRNFHKGNKDPPTPLDSSF